MKKLLLTLLLLLSLGFAASAGQLEITTSKMGMSGTSYTTYTKTNIDGTGFGIVLRASVNTGICFNKAANNCFLMVTENANNYNITSVTITFGNSQTKTSEIKVYKSDVAYVKESTDANSLKNVTASTLVNTFQADKAAHEAEINAPYFGLSYNGSYMAAMSSIVINYEEANPDAPVVKATAEGYNISVGDNKVAKGTQVTFTVENLGENKAEIVSDYDAEAAFDGNGAYTATIDKDGMVFITIGEKEYTYNFTLPYETVGAGTTEDPYTVADALALVEANEVGNEVYVAGKIISITEVSTQYGNATYVISDGEGHELKIYRGLWLNGEKFTAEDQLAVGADVVVLGVLSSYQGSAQVNNGNKLISYVDNTPKAPKVVVNAEGYTIKEGENESNEVKKGTQVTFTVENAGDLYVGVLSDYDDNADFVDGSYTATISKDGMVVVGLGDDYYTYNFTVLKVLPVVTATAGSVNFEAGKSYDVADGTVVTFAVENCLDEDIAATINGEDVTDIVDGKFTVTVSGIDETTEVYVYATNEDGEIEGTYTFVAKDTPKVAECTATYDFKKYDYGMVRQTGNDFEKVVKVLKEGVVTLTPKTAEKYRYWDADASFRISKNVKFTVAVPEGCYLTEINFKGKELTLDANAGTTTGTTKTEKTWTATKGSDISSVEFTGSTTGTAVFNTITVKYATEYTGAKTEFKGLTYEFGARGSENFQIRYMIHVDNHKSFDSYKAVLTVEDKEFYNYEHSLVENPAGAPMRTLDPEAVPSTHSFNGLVTASGLQTNTDYDMVLAIEHNGAPVHSVTIPAKTASSTTGIDDVTVDGNEEAEYFNLQGVRVAQPEAGQVYIVRRGAKVAKELVK